MSTREPATQPRLTLGPADAGRTLSAEEFADAVHAEPWTYERVDGRLVVMTPEGYRHVSASNSWRNHLIIYQHLNPGVIEDVVTNAWVRIDGGTDRIGDLGVYLVADPDGPKLPDRPPDLMFEIVSEGAENRKRDYIKKRAEYHKVGVREYVIIDRFQGRVTVLEHATDDYRERVLSPGDIYETPLLPGLAIPVAEVPGA